MKKLLTALLMAMLCVFVCGCSGAKLYIPRPDAALLPAVASQTPQPLPEESALPEDTVQPSPEDGIASPDGSALPEETPLPEVTPETDAQATPAAEGAKPTPTMHAVPTPAFTPAPTPTPEPLTLSDRESGDALAMETVMRFDKGDATITAFTTNTLFAPADMRQDYMAVALEMKLDGALATDESARALLMKHAALADASGQIFPAGGDMLQGTGDSATYTLVFGVPQNADVNALVLLCDDKCRALTASK